jgi:hypothetical protein
MKSRFLLAGLLLPIVASVGGTQAPPPLSDEMFLSRHPLPMPVLEPIRAADSVYVLARRALNQRNYDAAIPLFYDVTQRYPLAMVAPNAWYWVAYALHRRGVDRGDVEDLKAAQDALILHRWMYAEALTADDAADLALVVRGALAARGDTAAARYLERLQESSTPLAKCDSSMAASHDQALRGLARLEPDVAARTFAAIVSGSGKCRDLSLADPLYSRLAKRRDLKELVIAAYGQSVHPSAARRLQAIAADESDQVLRAEASAWLSAKRPAAKRP